MITADTARALVAKTRAEEENRVKEMAVEFCETLSAEICEKAKSMISGIMVSLPRYDIRPYVIEILNDNGFQTVAQFDGRIQIVW